MHKPEVVKAEAKKEKTLGQILYHSGERALSGGLPGMAAMAIQACTSV